MANSILTATRVVARYKSRCPKHLHLERRESAILAIPPIECQHSGLAFFAGSPRIAHPRHPAIECQLTPLLVGILNGGDRVHTGEATRSTLGAACTVVHKTCIFCASCCRNRMARGPGRACIPARGTLRPSATPIPPRASMHALPLPGHPPTQDHVARAARPYHASLFGAYAYRTPGLVVGML